MKPLKKEIQWSVIAHNDEADIPPEEDRTLTVGLEAIIGVLRAC